MIVCFSGLGGQGIVLLGVALGEAAARSGLNALQTQSYGAEARGGASYSTVMISRDRILDIAPEKFDVLVAMSQPAHDRFLPRLVPGGKLMYESDLVKAAGGGGSGIPATRLARERVGKELFANLVMFGHFVRVSRAVERDRAEEAVEAVVPAKTAESNLKAFRVGFDFK